LWLVAEAVDLLVHRAYLAGGITGLNAALDTDDALEHMLARLAAEWHYQRTKDWEAYQAIITAKPAGSRDILPAWAVTEVRDLSAALHRQRNRVARRGTNSSDEDGTTTTTRRRRRGGKATSAAAGAGGGGGAANSSGGGTAGGAGSAAGGGGGGAKGGAPPKKKP